MKPFIYQFTLGKKGKASYTSQEELEIAGKKGLCIWCTNGCFSLASPILCSSWDIQLVFPSVQYDRMALSLTLLLLRPHIQLQPVPYTQEDHQRKLLLDMMKGLTKVFVLLDRQFAIAHLKAQYGIRMYTHFISFIVKERILNQI